MSKKADNPDLFGNADAEGKKRHIYSVSEITQDIKLLLENTFSQVAVEGEISNLRPSASGHYYFSLKDETCILQAVIFSRAAKDMKFKLENGLKVICFGDVEVYGPHGKYQLIISTLEPKGVGSLQLALEQLKKKLELEGLFAPEHKKPIPQIPARIGVVTSLHGAAIKDILQVLERRFKDVHIVISPAKVQGEGAREEIAGAIEDFNLYNQSVPAGSGIDVLIVGRGGGSMEDLWAFNEEIVARAIYASKIPVISAVGHERDWSIADLVADLRAATPSVAAELVIPKKEDLENNLETLTADLKKSLQDNVSNLRGNLDELVRRLRLGSGHVLEINTGNFHAAVKKLQLLNPVSTLDRYQESLKNLSSQIYVRMEHFLALRRAGFVKAVEKLNGLSPLNILARGYSITFRFPEAEVVKEAFSVKPGDSLRTKLHSGEILSKVTEVKGNGGN